MKTFLLSLALIFSASLASANGISCERLGNSNNYRCTGGDTSYTVENANSAQAAAAAIQGQLQGQQQGQNQSSENSNSNSNSNSNANSNSNDNSSSATNGGNSVDISTPANTTSFNVGVGVSIRLGEGVQARSAREAADWLAKHGQDCIALDVILNSPQVRKLGYDVDCLAK